MRRFAMPVVRKATTTTFVSLLSALLLQACGGGGTPSDAEVEARRESLLAQEASHFTVTEVYSNSGANGMSNNKRALLVIDKRTNSIAHRIELQSDTGPYLPGVMQARWMTTSRNRLDADQKGYADLGIGQLLYIDAGRLLQMDLSGERLGTPRRVSTLTVCGMNWGAIELNGEGSVGWLPVSVPGTDGDCSNSANITNRIVPLGASTADAGLPILPDKQYIAAPQDANGLPLGVLLLENTPSGDRAQLVLVSPNDLQTRLQTLTLGPEASLEALAVDGGIELIGPFIGDTQQALLKIGRVVRKLDWRSGMVQIGEPIVTLHEPQTQFGQDLRHAYLADGCEVHQIDMNGNARLFATLPGDAGSIERIVPTDNQVLIQQYAWAPAYASGASVQRHGCDSPPNDEGMIKVHVVNKASGAMRLMHSGTGADWMFVMGRTGDLVYLQRSAAGGIDIQRHDLNSGAHTVIAQKVSLINGYVRPRHQRFDFDDISGNQLLWCQPPAENTYSCEAGTDLISHTVATGQNVVVGKMPSLLDKLPGDITPDEYSYLSTYVDYDFDGLHANNPGVLTFSLYFSSPTTWGSLTVPWMVTPGVADSLREIPYTP